MTDSLSRNEGLEGAGQNIAFEAWTVVAHFQDDVVAFVMCLQSDLFS